MEARRLILPPGVHPLDASTAPHHSEPVPHDDPIPIRRRRGWDTKNAHALPVFERLGRDFATDVYVASVALTGGTIQVVGFTPGRTRLTLWVPLNYFPGGTLTTTPAGVIIAEDPGKAQQFHGTPLFVGDSMDISSEAPVWAGVQPGQTIGIVAWLDCWDADASLGL